MIDGAPYQIWVVDCDNCSSQTALGEDLVDTEVECDGCGEPIRLAL